MPIASSSKWVGGVAIMAVVAASDGRLGLDTPAHALLPYWTDDRNDPRSRVTLRNLLAFTSGMSGGGGCEDRDFVACAEHTYSNARSATEPGSTFEYGLNASVRRLRVRTAATLRAPPKSTQRSTPCLTAVTRPPVAVKMRSLVSRAMLMRLATITDFCDITMLFALRAAISSLADLTPMSITSAFPPRISCARSST